MLLILSLCSSPCRSSRVLTCRLHMQLQADHTWVLGLAVQLIRTCWGPYWISSHISRGRQPEIRCGTVNSRKVRYQKLAMHATLSCTKAPCRAEIAKEDVHHIVTLPKTHNHMSPCPLIPK